MAKKKAAKRTAKPKQRTPHGATRHSRVVGVTDADVESLFSELAAIRQTLDAILQALRGASVSPRR